MSYEVTELFVIVAKNPEPEGEGLFAVGGMQAFPKQLPGFIAPTITSKRKLVPAMISHAKRYARETGLNVGVTVKHFTGVRDCADILDDLENGDFSKLENPGG